MDDYDIDAAIARAEDERLELLADWDDYEEDNEEEF